jgi:hypothetical protein
MCEEAFEIQALAGEARNDEHSYFLLETLQGLDKNGKKVIRQYRKSSFSHYCDHRNVLSAVAVLWLPRQDQLQDMCFDGEGVNAGNVKIFADWCFKVADPDGIYPKMLKWSMEACWLAFVMHEKYKKIWDGEGWL